MRLLLAGKRLAADHIARTLGAAVVVAIAPATPVGAVIGVGIGGAVVAFFLGQQRLPVGDRNLIVVGMDFREGQKAVAVAAVIDKCRLQRRLNPGDFGEIDVTAKLLAVSGLEVEFLDAVAAEHHDTGFLRMGRVDEHFVGHWKFSLGRTGPRSRATIDGARRRMGWSAILVLREGCEVLRERGAFSRESLAGPIASRALTIISRKRGTSNCLCCELGSMKLTTRSAAAAPIGRRRGFSSLTV